MNATGISETGGENPILSKKIDVGSVGDPITSQVDFFVHLLNEDRAQTGVFTALPEGPDPNRFGQGLVARRPRPPARVIAPTLDISGR